MAHAGSHIETEIKLRVSDPDAARGLLEKKGFVILQPRVFEANAIYDTVKHSLRQRGELIRLRRVGELCVLTFKSRDLPGKHKRREELETQVSDPDVIGAILERLGLGVVFRYEKYRAEYQRPSEEGIVTLDETPLGTFFELEGSAEWIDATARELGFEESDYIVASYGALYFEHCRRNRIHPGNMVFSSRL